MHGAVPLVVPQDGRVPRQAQSLGGGGGGCGVVKVVWVVVKTNKLLGIMKTIN